jgi:ubiquinone/menaquinone biosynthesis C-methylase UbiE
MKMRPFEKRFVNAPGHSRQVAARAVERLRHVPLRAGWRYLDVGCGNGRTALHVADTLGLRVVGVDVDAEQIELARRAAAGRTAVEFVVASVTDLPFAAAAFDIVSSNKTMHHVPEWRVALDEIKRVVAPDRFVVFADLTMPALLTRLLRPAVGHRAGVFTRSDLDRGFSGLRDVHRNARWLHYEAVFTKC